MQLKQATQRLGSISNLSISIHPALQTPSHDRHDRHFFLSMTNRKREKRDTMPKSAPTGQIVLQYARPEMIENARTMPNDPMDTVRMEKGI
jgi:hypothetical protein